MWEQLEEIARLGKVAGGRRGSINMKVAGKPNLVSQPNMGGEMLPQSPTLSFSSTQSYYYILWGQGSSHGSPAGKQTNVSLSCVNLQQPMG